MIQSPLALAALIAAVAALGFWLEKRFSWARTVGASLLIIGLGALLSNLDLVPATSPVYGVVSGPITSLAIVWLLLGVNLGDLRAAGPRMLLAFGLAVAATCIAAFVSTMALGSTLPGEAWKLAGVLTGTYAGGSLNFVAIAREVGLSDSVFAATAAADNVLTALWMGATLMLPVWLGPLFARRAGTDGGKRPTEEAPSSTAKGPASLLEVAQLRPFDLMTLFALGLTLILAADRISTALPQIPGVVWLTTLALVVAQLPAVRRLEGAFTLGLISLNLFFVIIGIGSRVAEMLRMGPQIFVVTALVVALHGLILYSAAWLFRLDAGTTSVASQAAVGGPSTAMALAAARGWPELALPGVLVGLLGYAVGNYAGLAMAALVRSLG